MSNDREHLDPIERALLELQAAEEANLFSRTGLDAGALLRAGAAPVGYAVGRTLLRWLSAAAVLGIAVGIWGLIFTTDHGPNLDADGIAHTVVLPGGDLAPCDGGFFGCFSGPRNDPAPSGRCRTHDYDSDGDVDLADYGAYQLAYVDPQTRTH